MHGIDGLCILDPVSDVDGATKALFSARMRVWRGYGRGESEVEIIVEITQKTPPLLSLVNFRLLRFPYSSQSYMYKLF